MEQGNLLNLTAFVLTAGYSSRMGDFKPLLPVGEITALERVLNTAKEAGFQEIIAVTGYKREALRGILENQGVREAYNENFSKGMFTSIQAGIRTARENQSSAYLLMLVDCPVVPVSAIRRMAAEHMVHPDCFLIPCYRGKKGHPILIPSQYGEEILNYHGDGGLKAVMNRYADKVRLLETGEEGVVLDMDTPAGYQDVLNMLKPKEPLDFRGRLFLIRHGQTEQHAEKVFIGQTDVPLNEEGQEQAQAVGLFLTRHEAKFEHIYCSDLKRSKDTAEIAGNTVIMLRNQIPELRPEAGLREMNLGDWDGHFIREIQEKYPEEYKARGEDLLRFKIGHDGENFYDLRYRVMKCLEKILRIESREAALRGEDDKYRDLIIVAHSGVLRVLLSDLQGVPLEEAVKMEIPKGAVIILDFA